MSPMCVHEQLAILMPSEGVVNPGSWFPLQGAYPWLWFVKCRAQAGG